MDASQSVTRSYLPTDSLIAGTVAQQSPSNTIENRTTTVAKVILNDNGHEVVLEGKDAEAYIVGSQFLQNLAPLFESIIDEMLDDPAMIKFLEDSCKSQKPLLSHEKVEELDINERNSPLPQAVKV
jgi:hypothetical protein